MISRRYFKLFLFLILGNYVEAMDTLLEELIEASGALNLEATPTSEVALPTSELSSKSNGKHCSASRRLKDIEKKLNVQNQILEQQTELLKEQLRLLNHLANGNQQLLTFSQRSKEMSRPVWDCQLLEGAKTGNLEKVREALIHKAWLWTRDTSTNNFYTPLHWAAELGHVEIAKELLARGATVNNCNGITQANPLQLAARKGHLEIVKLLAPPPSMQAITNS
jgi:ankyrin repeat protein